jgi:transposase
MLDALIRGERDPGVLAQYAQRRMRSKIPELVEALTGRFSDHHAFLARLYLDEIDAHTRTIDALTRRIEAAIKPYDSAREALVSIPGFPQWSRTPSSPKPELT